MNEAAGGRPTPDRKASKTFLPCFGVDPSEYEALALTATESRSVLVLSAADWQRVLDQQGFDAQQRAELASAAAMLAALGWIASDLLALLKSIRAEVDGQPAVAFALLCHRLESHLSQHKATP